MKSPFPSHCWVFKLSHYVQPQPHSRWTPPTQSTWKSRSAQPRAPGTEEHVTWCKIPLSSGGPKGTSEPEGYGWYVCALVWGAWMMSCSVRKKGPKCVSKYSFSRRAWLPGADHRSTGLVVTRTNTRPDEQAAIKAREKTTMQPGFRTQKEPQWEKSRLSQPSNAAPSASQQDASPARADRKGGRRLRAK